MDDKTLNEISEGELRAIVHKIMDFYQTKFDRHRMRPKKLNPRKKNREETPQMKQNPKLPR